MTVQYAYKIKLSNVYLFKNILNFSLYSLRLISDWLARFQISSCTSTIYIYIVFKIPLMNTQSPIRSFDTLGTTHLFFYLVLCEFFSTFNEDNHALFSFPSFTLLWTTTIVLTDLSSFINRYPSFSYSFFSPYSFYTTTYLT